MAVSAGRTPSGKGKGPRLRVGVVSAGRVGAVLGAALRQSGHEIVAVSGVSEASLHRAEELLPGVDVLGPDEVARRSDLVLLAVPDDALPGLIRGLVATGSLRKGQIVAHTSGANGVGVLAPAAEVGVLPLALAPAMTFTGRVEDLQRLPTACFAVTAPELDEAAWNVGEVLVLELGAEPVRVPEDRRRLYHAALTHGSNHLITLVNECADLLGRVGVEHPGQVMGPLLSAALDNALRYGDRAITGPVSRGDVGTVRAHLDVLGDADPAVLPGYRELAARTADRAERSGVLAEQAAEDVRRVLRDEER